MRLSDEALFFEGGHVIANRGRRDPQLVAVSERLRADRLTRGDVVLDDGPKNGEPAILQHGYLPCPWARLALSPIDCQCKGEFGTVLP
ncbi:unannotated protein [freshwater metagenome]|uniref:Unannotated protein n=1 Tax=freshwater metagenome TaxID=449393 RepID=A0A6J7IIL3_9ZZZZ